MPATCQTFGGIHGLIDASQPEEPPSARGQAHVQQILWRKALCQAQYERTVLLCHVAGPSGSGLLERDRGQATAPPGVCRCRWGHRSSVWCGESRDSRHQASSVPLLHRIAAIIVKSSWKQMRGIYTGRSITRMQTQDTQRLALMTAKTARDKGEQQCAMG